MEKQIHLLAPAFESLGDECLGGTWAVYSWPPAIAMASVYFIFITEFFAFRFGTARLEKLGLQADPHNVGDEGNHTAHEHQVARSASHLSQANGTTNNFTRLEDGKEPKYVVDAKDGDLDGESDPASHARASAQILGVAILGKFERYQVLAES